MAQFRIFESIDVNAPILTGQSGSIIPVFDYFLVSGSGWTKSFFNTASMAVYRIPTGSGMYLNVQDNAATSSTKEVVLWGYENAVGQNTGSNQFPSQSQGVGNKGYLILRKSNIADGQRREWIAFADSRSFYFFTLTGDNATFYNGCAFGDYYSYSASFDPYNCIIAGNSLLNSTSDNMGSSNGLDATNTNLNAANAGLFTSRNFVAATGTSGSSTGLGKHGDAAFQQTLMRAAFDNALYISPFWLTDGSRSPGVVRGTLRGAWYIPMLSQNFTDGETFSGSTFSSGRVFRVIKHYSGINWALAMEISDTLDTN